jgi:hypothetical protein
MTQYVIFAGVLICAALFSYSEAKFHILCEEGLFMKTRMLLALAMSLSFSQVYAQFEEQVLNSDPIHVDGYLAEDKPVMDGELAGIRNELKKQKTSTQLNKENIIIFRRIFRQYFCKSYFEIICNTSLTIFFMI